MGTWGVDASEHGVSGILVYLVSDEDQDDTRGSQVSDGSVILRRCTFDVHMCL